MMDENMVYDAEINELKEDVHAKFIKIKRKRLAKKVLKIGGLMIAGALAFVAGYAIGSTEEVVESEEV